MTVLEKKAQEVGHKPLDQLYEETFPVVARFVSKMGGSFQDARDIFHDSLVIFLEKPATHPVPVSEGAYILGIAKHLWCRKFTSDKRKVSFEDSELQLSFPEDYFPSVKTMHLFQVIRLTGKKCMEILHAFYYSHEPMKSLARMLGYSNAHSATVQKHKCLEKIRETVQQKSMKYEDFLE